jgi:hypothetical protein
MRSDENKDCQSAVSNDYGKNIVGCHTRLWTVYQARASLFAANLKTKLWPLVFEGRLYYAQVSGNCAEFRTGP